MKVYNDNQLYKSPAGDQLWNSGRQNWIFGRIGDQEGAILDPGLGKGGGGVPQPARIFRIYFLLKEFSPLSWSLEQAKLKWEVKNVKLKMKNGTGEGLNFLELSSVTGFSLRIPLAVLQ